MLVAVYGTLKKGRGNSHVMQRAGGALLGTDVLSGYIMYSNGGFPVVYHDDNPDNQITVEVYEIQDVNPLDALEGHPTWYRRELVPTAHGEAWIYIMRNENYKNNWSLVQSGEF